MALFQALFAWFIHSIGTVLNSAVSWATLLLFGKVPDDRQTVLSAISLISILWLITVVGVIFPRFGVFLLILAPLKSIDEQWISLTMLFLVAVLPFANGILSRFLDDQEVRQTGWRSWWRSARTGWRLTVALSLTLVLMIIIAPLNKLGELMKRWRSEYVPVVIEPRDYALVTKELCDIMESAGIKCCETKPTIIMQAPVWLLVALTGGTLKRLVADKLTKLVYKDGELEIRPSDLIVRGTRRRTNDVLALLIHEFGFGKAYLSWSKEANRLEDEMREIWMSLKSRTLPRGVLLVQAEACFEKLKDLHLRREEWEILYRLCLKLKLDIWENIGDIERKAG